MQWMTLRPVVTAVLTLQVNDALVQGAAVEGPASAAIHEAKRPKGI